MSKNIGKKLTTTPKSNVPVKSKAASSKDSEKVINKKIVTNIKGAVNSNDNMTKPVIKSRVPQSVSKPMTSINSTNFNKIKSSSIETKSVSSPRIKAAPLKATVPMVTPKTNIAVKKTAPTAKKEITKTKISAAPLKAKLTVAPSSTKSHSIMTPIHNVTVSSPPAQRKEIVIEPMIEEHIDEPITPRMRERTRTRTLEPHEVLILQSNLAQAISKHVAESPTEADSLEPDVESSLTSNNVSETIKVKTPVSFEIQFEEPKKSSPNKLNPIDEPVKKSSDSEYDDYEDDFESYESDFESEHSTSATSDNISDSSANNSDASEDNSATYTKSGTSMDNTYKVNLDDRKFDSGNYDMDMRGESNSLVDLKTRPQEPLGSVFEENDENYTNDSGLGYFEAIRTPNPTPAADIITHLNITKAKPSPRKTRGYELMQKIHLDEMQFSLFELKPMTYEYYMKIYGNYNSGQNSTQTNDDCMHQEIQTDVKFVKTVWTQNPPCLTKSSLENYQSLSYYHDKIGVGYDIEDDDGNQSRHIRASVGTEMTIEKYNRLNDLLQKALVTISNIIYRKSRKRLSQTALTISNGFRPISSSEIIKMFSANCFVFTIQKVENRELIYVWNVYSLEAPYRVLSCWSNVECFLVLNECIVFCGLCNGSISVWDLREPFYWHTEILNNSNVRIASQIILPELSSDLLEETKDFGKVVDFKLMENDEQIDILSSYNTTQLCSLHEYGLITIWTFIEHKYSTFDTNITLPKTTNYLNNLSPWSRINLIQNSVLNVNQYFMTTEQNPKLSRNKTTFHKTIEYFDNNIFNDKILQELNRTNDDTSNQLCDMKNINYNRIEYIAKYGYFVNLSKNYLLFIKKSLKLSDIRKIFIDTNKLVKCVDFQKISHNKLFITFLSDGSCKILSILNYLNQFYQQYDSEIGAVSLTSDNHKPCGSGISASSISPTSTNNDLLVGSKSCTIQNMVKDERQIYSTEMNHFDLPEIKIINKTSNNTIMTTVSHQNVTKIFKTINLVNNNDLKFLLLNNKSRSRSSSTTTTTTDKITLSNYYLFKFNENLILNQFHNVLYLYNIETCTQTNLMSGVKYFTVIENLNNRNYLILLVETNNSNNNSSDSIDDAIQIHELNDKLLNF